MSNKDIHFDDEDHFLLSDELKNSIIIEDLNLTINKTNYFLSVDDKVFSIQPILFEIVNNEHFITFKFNEETTILEFISFLEENFKASIIINSNETTKKLFCSMQNFIFDFVNKKIKIQIIN